MRSELRRAWLACAWMLGALLVAGCGPGVGGTGTGDAAFAAFGASAAPVCGGTVAAALSCPSAPAGAGAAWRHAAGPVRRCRRARSCSS